MVEITFQNLGPIESGKIEIAPLTVICGRNNVGKTYVSHTIFCALEKKNSLADMIYAISKPFNEFQENASELFGEIEFDAEEIIPDIEKILIQKNKQLSAKELNDFFNVGSSLFKDLNIELSYKKDIRQLLFERDISRLFDDQERLCNVTKIANSFVFTATYAGIPREKHHFNPYVYIVVTLIEIISQEIFPGATIITSERTGIAVFHKALDSIASELGHEVSTKIRSGKRQSIKHLTNSISDVFNFSTAIKNNINQIRHGESSNKNLSDIFNDDMRALLEKITGGAFEELTNEIKFRPKGATTSIPMGAASSSVKSIYLIENYVKYFSKKGGVVVIDEPELNLHLDNQVEMARLIATLVNAGVKVVITTHSDHLLRELNSLIMLSSEAIPNDEKNELIERYEIPASSILKPESVKAYVISSNEKKVFEAKVSAFGINLDLFNKEILRNNRKIRELAGVLNDYLSETGEDND